MPSVFPENGLDTFPTVSGGASLNGHADLHNDLKDAVEALEDKVGIDGSTVTDSIDYKLAHLGDTYYTETEVDNALAAKLDSSAYTAEDVLTKIKTVDGSTSGLDADTLDGSHATAFALAHTHPYLSSTGTAVNSEKLDSLDSTQFLRSDANDTVTGRITSTNNGLTGSWDTCQFIVAPSGDAGIAIRTGGQNKYTIQMRAGGTGDGSSIPNLYLTGHVGNDPGLILSNVTCGTVFEGSSRRFKTNITPAYISTNDDAVEKIKQIPLSSFKYVADTEADPVIGVIAEDLIDVFPEAVVYQDDQPTSVATQRMTYLNMGAIQQLINKVETLEARVAELEAR